MKLDVRTPLARLAEMSDGELSVFQSEVIDALGSLPEGADSAAAIGQLHALQSASDAVRREFSRREAAFAAETVTASGARTGNVRRMARRQGRVVAGPETSGATSPHRAVLTASGNLRGVPSGSVIESRDQLAEAMTRTLQGMDRNGAARGPVICASAAWSYPEDRQLGEDPWANGRKMDAVTSPQALVATGGICAPVNVDYTVPTWATADRPLRDGLPPFQATRGGLRYVTPPDVGDLAGATGIWTEATDANPGAATKPVIQIACGSEEAVYLEAVATRLGFGNMQGRFAPEQVAANTDLAMAAAARIAENNLLNLLAGLAVADVTAPPSSTGLGATRDLLSILGQAAARYRNVHRLSPDTTLTLVLPAWGKELIRIDLAREIAHAQDSTFNSLMVGDEQIEELFTVRALNPIWHLDGQDSSVSGGVSQMFTAQSASSAIETFPAKMVFYLFVEGCVQFLDGGRLDLGVVRDSTLDATNDYELFSEQFESLANRGFANSVIQYVASLSANGASTGTVTPPAGA